MTLDVSKFKIDKDVPLPDDRPKYPLGEMEIGDSFLVENEPDPRKLRGAVYQYGRRNGREYAVNKVGEEAYRVWRKG